jgi:hypothetical protein
MPMSNMKYRLRVQDKYKHWFPLEDPTPYWEDIHAKVVAWDKTIESTDNPTEILDFLIYVTEKVIEFRTCEHSPADNPPIFYFIASSSYYKLLPIWPDMPYYLALRHMGNLKDPEFIKMFLETFYKLRNNEYTPLSEIVKVRIQRRYREYNRKYDPTLASYNKLFA